MTVIISVLIATLVAQPLLGSFESIFQYIQNFTGYFSPGIVVIFLVALFWKKATSMSVLGCSFNIINCINTYKY